MTKDDNKKASLFSILRGYFLVGILVAVSLGSVLFIAWQIILFTYAMTNILIHQLAAYLPPEYADIYILGLGIILTLIFLILIGLILIGLFTVKIPVVRPFYSGLKQVLAAVFSDKKSAFTKVVLVEYPHKGMWRIAFKTGDTVGEVGALAETKMINVFVPATPNPTAGFLLFVPEDDIIELDMPVKEGIKYVISAGIIVPDFEVSEDGEVNDDTKLVEGK